MAIKSTTIVVNATKSACENVSLAPYVLAAERCLKADPASAFSTLGEEVLEIGENYVITRAEEKITVLFYHDGENDEDIPEKITLTGLVPSAEFSLEQYMLGGAHLTVGKRRANSAGILEAMFSVPAHSLVILQGK